MTSMDSRAPNVRTAIGPLTRAEMVTALQAALGPDFSEDDISAALEAAIDARGAAVPIGASGRRLELDPNFAEQLRVC